MAKPNILLIMTDQQRADAIGCTGGWVNTPHLDRIAAEGVLFPNCITTSPVCIPARLSLATGLYPHSTGVWKNCPHTMAPDAPNWMRAIRDAGYRTSLFGKTHLHPHGGDLRDREDLMHAYGLDDVDEIGGPRASARLLSHMTERWQSLGLWDAYRADYKERFSNTPHVVRPSALPLEEYADTYVGRQAADYLRSYDRDQPWFCWVSFGGPHEPWDTPEPYASMYDPQTMPAPAMPVESASGRPRGILDARLAAKPDLSPEHIAAMRADYAGNVTLIDEQIGILLEVLEQRGELNNTVIVVSSDHGELNGDYGLIYKETFLNGCLKVPLIVRTPQTVGRGGGRCTSPAEWLDIGPTLAQAAGAELDYTQFGVSLMPAAMNPDHVHRDDAISEYDGEVVILTTEWKMAVNAAGAPYLLFNVLADPDESYNLVADPAKQDVIRDLQARLLARLVSSQVKRHP